MKNECVRYENAINNLNKLPTCLTEIDGLQSFSTSKSERHTVPDGKTFGWNNGGSNLPAICLQPSKEIWYFSLGSVFEILAKLLFQYLKKKI